MAYDFQKGKRMCKTCSANANFLGSEGQACAGKWKSLKAEAEEARGLSLDRFRQEQQRHEETQNERNKYKVRSCHRLSIHTGTFRDDKDALLGLNLELYPSTIFMIPPPQGFSSKSHRCS